MFGPGFDRVSAALAAEGIRPDQVETVWLTHLHADHVGGLLTADRRARFPRAELVVQDREAAYWSDERARAGASPAIGPMFETAQAVLAAHAGRIRRIAGEVELAPASARYPCRATRRAIWALLVEDGTERLLIWGDILHSRCCRCPIQTGR